MRERIREVLERVTSQPALESAWLQTLSLLEFIGARKISRTVAAHHPPLEVLQHWADETRHAAAFAALAVEVLPHALPAYLCPEAAKAYFSELDTSLNAWTTGRGAADAMLDYLLVTTVVERRAMQLYPIYRAASRHPRVREELAQVIVEEQAHRVAIEAACQKRLGESRLEEALALEEKLFGRFWGELERHVKGVLASAA